MVKATHKKKMTKYTYKPKAKGTVANKDSKKSLEKAVTEVLFQYRDDKTVVMTEKEITPSQDGTVSSCRTVIPVRITTDFTEMYQQKIENKYEQYRISKLEVQIHFKNTDSPVFFIQDFESMPLVHPRQIEHDPNQGWKVLSEEKNFLTLTWTPTSDADYTYQPTTKISEMAGALAYIKILQHNINIAPGKPGCSMRIKMSVACKGLKGDGVYGANLDEAELERLTNLN